MSFCKEINSNPIFTRVLRYRSTTAGSDGVFTRADLLASCVSLSSASTTATSIFEAVRLVRMKVYVMPNDDGDLGEVVVSFPGDRSPGTVRTLMSTNAVPAVAMIQVPRNSLASYWSEHAADTSEVLFSLESATGVRVVLDIHLQFTVGNGSTATVTLTAAPGVNGVGYVQLPFSDASNAFTIVGLQSVTVA
jgi:hypothetical protein